MSLSTLQLAGTSALALLAGSGDVAHALPIVFDESVFLRASLHANAEDVAHGTEVWGWR
jgi:hypothetical protein